MHMDLYPRKDKSKKINLDNKIMFHNSFSQHLQLLEIIYRCNWWEPLTLAEIGRQINVSRERVRQLEAKAILKLRVMTTHQKAA